jgi:hypothetical protein
MHLVSARRDRRLWAVVFASFTLAFVALTAFAARAQATETLYWNNYSGDPDSIGYSNPDGSGGGALNLSGVELDGPEGMAIDPVGGRLYIAAISNATNGQIVYTSLTGAGSGIFTAPGAPVDNPEGLTIDPATRTMYWINTAEATQSIAWARLDGSAGGTLNLTGATFDQPYRLALDPVAHRVYFGSEVGTGPETHLVLSYANLDNSGGGNVNITGSTPTGSLNGIAVDPAHGRVYWLNESAETLSYANLDNSGGGDINTAGAAWDGPYGLALDPGTGSAIWANYGHGEERTGAFGTANYLTGGSGGAINVATAPVDGPQDPNLLKSPVGTGAPAVAKSATSRSSLSCSTGSWAPDYPGSFVYQAPQSFGYAWALNGQAIAGATGSTLTATSPGAYTCSVTGTNIAGSTTQTSAPLTENAAKLKLALKKKKAVVKAGKSATFALKATNQGDIAPKAVRVCVKVPKKAKQDLKPSKCKPLKINAAGKGKAKVKVKAKPSAEGVYKVKIQVKGVPGKAAKATIKVVG